MFQALRAAGQVPNTTTHNIVIASFMDANDYQGVLGQYAMMESEGVQPDLTTFRNVVLAHEATGDHAKVKEVLALQESLRLIHGQKY
mmetsp:Transcript_25855/g.46013  ORF Transcript_25855/g.46013 Transcript_25855/m.46013 type:complete len:87 (+) Transcript_25855:306-566(+)